jgi:hypothetical protein
MMRGIVALICALMLGCSAATAQADGIVPVEGPWHATTSAGLPVTFEVTPGQVVRSRFRFKWGFCGTFESGLGPPVPIEADGHWKHVEGQGPFIEATFVAPDRAEGTVTAPSRELPGCPETRATFVAEPGEGPFEQAPAVVRADVRERRLVHKPTGMLLKRDGSLKLYGLRWRGWGEPTAHASGSAYLRRGCRRCTNRLVRRPRVTVALNELTQQGDYRVYLHIRYDFHGPIPSGFARHGSRILE